MSPRVVLVGPPGAGKTTIGRRLANRLGVEFRDTDTDVETMAGMTVANIFTELGEATFRRLETEAVAKALTEHHGVLALGGGAVLNPATRELLKQQPVVWLDISLSLAVKRVGVNASRPLLIGNVRSKLATLLAERTPLYQEVARWRVESVDGSPDRLADQIQKLVTDV